MKWGEFPDGIDLLHGPAPEAGTGSVVLPGPQWLLILDEPTASIDAPRGRNAASSRNAGSRCPGTRRVILTSHRFSTVVIKGGPDLCLARMGSWRNRGRTPT